MTYPTTILLASRVMIWSTSLVASRPVIRYLNSGVTSMSAATCRMAWHSCSWWVSYELTA